MKKQRFPRRLLVVQATDIADDPVLIAHETPEEISEEYADQKVAVYELVTVGQFNVEKSVDGKPPKTRYPFIDLDNASHQQMASYVQEIGLKLYTKNMSTKALRKTLREWLVKKK